MNLVPFLVKVHYEPKYKEDIRKGIQNIGFKTYVLTDDQALYVEDGNVTFLGNQPRIILDQCMQDKKKQFTKEDTNNMSWDEKNTKTGC